MEPGLELPISIPARHSRDRLRALHRQLRAAILEGRLRPGVRLPPTRALAATYGVSRNTAVATYDLLASEGYLSARGGAGTFVTHVLPKVAERKPAPERSTATDRRLNAFWRRAATLGEPSHRSELRYDFHLGVPDLRHFPADIWRRLSSRTLRAFAKAPALYESPHGREGLREAIAGHVSFARAVACRGEDITVTAGAQQAFDMLARILVTSSRTVVAVENPGYAPTRAAFAAAGARLVNVPVDAEGLIVERLPRNVRVVCVTPSHQFPLGTVMSARRRAALLEFAQARGAVVIEDDYDAEFRFGERPLDALQTLDRSESVFYIGTFSKSLFPSIRLGFIVAPSWAHAALGAVKQYTDWHCAVLMQETLAAFISEGHLARHVRRMRAIYADRRSVLLDGLKAQFSSRLQPLPSSAGLHLTAMASDESLDVDTLVRKARERDVGIHSLGRFYYGKPGPPGIVFGYGALDRREIPEALARLRAVIAR
jgi:GntR family transcriptional regulator/MocR family aminotransferase